ncbi:MAG: hypothetical protein HFE25_04750 [Clostridia bacterium]|jgi:hypothetical protein|nr:hypothetical protein [Clostridia bacterium]
MSLRRIEQVKGKKPFAVWDLLIYGVLAVFIAVLFIVFVFGGNRDRTAGIRLVFREQVVYTYSFQEGGKAAQGWENRVALRTEGDTVFLTFYSDEEGKRFNTLMLDLKNGSAKMTNANCSRHKDCTFMEEITTQKGVIVCVPHGLKVLALEGSENFDKPSLG